VQTLNVGAGRTDQEYKAAEDEHRADLLAESRNNANYFFIAAVLAGIGCGLFLFRLNFLVSIGAYELLTIYGRETIRQNPLLGYAAGVVWAAILVGLGFAARKGYRWAFLAGVALYAGDMIALAITFSVFSIGVHGFFVLKWFQGQKALEDLKATKVSP
jgi:4-hydroxybenzoate polyprenyltransferase